MGDHSETRNDEHQSGLESDNFEGASGGNQDAGGDQLQQKNKKQRYTPQQLWELEAYGFVKFFIFIYKCDSHVL